MEACDFLTQGAGEPYEFFQATETDAHEGVGDPFSRLSPRDSNAFPDRSKDIRIVVHELEGCHGDTGLSPSRRRPAL
ncbi:hypothetical protein MTO96_014649 [Rhipicephalus appendiculatus]